MDVQYIIMAADIAAVLLKQAALANWRMARRPPGHSAVGPAFPISANTYTHTNLSSSRGVRINIPEASGIRPQETDRSGPKPRRQRPDGLPQPPTEPARGLRILTPPQPGSASLSSPDGAGARYGMSHEVGAVRLTPLFFCFPAPPANLPPHGRVVVL